MSINLRVKQELEDYLKNRAGRGAKKAVVISTYKLDEKELEEIRKSFPALGEYSLNNFIDETILGGLVIKFNTKVIDLSLSGQLKNFKKIMYEID